MHCSLEGKGAWVSRRVMTGIAGVSVGTLCVRSP